MSTNILNQPQAATIFERRDNPRGKRVKIAVSELPELIRKTSAANKNDLPLIKFATFKNDRRSDANLIECTAVEGDYDGGQVAMESAAKMCREAGISAIFYTSPSWTAENPRWRVIAPLSKPIEPEERTRMLARLNGVLGGILAPESFAQSQSYFYGSVGRKKVRVEVVDGRAVDRLARLDAGAIGKEGASRDLTKPRDGVDRSAVLRAIAIDVVKAGGSIEE